MSRKLFAGAIALLSPWLAIDARAADVVLDPPVLVNRVAGDVSVDAEGVVQAYHVTSDVPASLATAVEGLVKQMRFDPVMEGDKAVPVTVPMRVTLTAQPLDDGGMNLQLDNIAFVAPKNGECPWRPGDVARPLVRPVSRVPVVYPLGARMTNASADVLASVRVNQDGTVANVAIIQSALIDARGEPDVVARLLVDFEAATLDALRQWRWEVRPIPGTPVTEPIDGMVPVRFTMMHSAPRKPGDWVWMTRDAKRPSPWTLEHPGIPSPGVADVLDDEQVCSSVILHVRSPAASASAAEPMPTRASH